jgi:hypothetical protein
MHTAILILSLLSAQADEAPSADPKTRAQTLLSEGTQLFNRGAMAEALDRFKQAYAEYASPKLLFNIGLTSRNLGRSVEAMDAFEKFLGEASDSPPDMIAEAKKVVGELRGMLGNLSIKCSTPGAEVALDGRIIGFAPVPNSLWVTPGSHLITAQHPGFSPATVTVDVNAGTVHTLTLTMLRVSEEPVMVPGAAENVSATKIAGATPEAASALSTDAPKAQPKGWWLGRTWTWVAASSAVVLAGGAVAFGLSMRSRYDSLNRSCGSASPEYLGCSSNDVSSVTWRRNTANVLWGLSAAAAVTAGVLFVWEGHNIAVTPLAGHATGMMAQVSY